MMYGALNNIKCSSLGSCEGYYDMKRGTRTMSGTDIDTANDLSGKGVNVSQATPNDQPPFSAVGWDGKLPTMLCNRDTLGTPASGYPIGANAARSIIMVLDTGAQPPVSNNICWGDSGNIIDFGNFLVDNLIRIRNSSNETNTGQNSILYGKHVVIITSDPTNFTKVYLDGTLIFTDVANRLNEALNIQSVGICGDPAVITRCAVANISINSIHSKTLSQNEIRAISQKLRAEWSVDPFSPLSMGVPIDLWADFSAGIPIVTYNGSNISYIKDKSGNVRDGEQTVSIAQPGGTNTLNGKTISSYEGNDYLDFGNILNYTGVATIFFVGRVRDAVGGARFIAARGVATARYYDIHRDNTTGKLQLYDGVTGHVSNKVLNLGEWYRIRIELNGASSKFYVNNIDEGTFNYAPTGTTAAPLQFGNYGSSTAHLTGDIAEAFLCPSILSFLNSGRSDLHYKNKFGL